MSAPQWQVVGRVTEAEHATFSHVGPLIPRQGRSGWPITGTYLVTEFAAAVTIPPVDGDIVLALRVGAAVLGRVTLTADATLAVLRFQTPTTVASGDRLAVDIESVGGGFPGADLVAKVRLQATE